MDILNKLKRQVLVYDGAMGTMLQEKGLRAGGCPEEWNILHPDRVLDIHKAYIDAGADIVETNSFGGNRLALGKYKLGNKCHQVNYQAVKIAKKTSSYVAASVGPLPEMVEPLGRLSFSEALEIFKEQIKALAKAGPDLILFETFSDIKELRIAVIAAREVCKLPIQAQMTFTEDGTTISGTTPEVAVVVLEGLGVDIIGANCSVGPRELYVVMKRIARNARPGTYISVLPNAGIPTQYHASPEEMARYSKKYMDLGINLIGGCCGTNPGHIKEISKEIKSQKPVRRPHKKTYLTTASRTQIVEFKPKKTPYIIGERINPSRRKALQEELRSGKTTLIRHEAQTQTAYGADLLDINVSVSGIDEIATMGKVVNTVQNTVNLPLVIDSPNPKTIEAGLKQSAGKPIINSVNGEKGKLKEMLPLARKYGAGIIALTMDDKGIPMLVNSRISIAKKIIKEAVRIGIRKEDILVDFLTLASAAQPGSAKITLAAIKRHKGQTILGISNISFGLPDRAKINNTFMAMASKNGLTAAIANPMELDIKGNKNAQKILLGKKTFIQETSKETLYDCILTGDKDNINEYIERYLKEGKNPLEINHKILIPALEEVGKRYERKEYFLPQLLLSAEAMQKAVARLEKVFPKGHRKGTAKVLMATVKGDLHDIGKNIVCSVLKNYGYTVFDLGKNVSSGKIIQAAKQKRVNIIGLSALMTTTMGQMEVVIDELKRHDLDIPTVIGGAVINSSYAKKIGAAGYARDAVSAVGEIKRILKK